MGNKFIEVRGAREHNLKNVTVKIPRDKFVVFTGLSGSGKSSLAFDTIYAEGRRRYVESLSSYARQFLGQMSKPRVDSIEGLSPAISIDQKTTSKNPRSTVGTVTEIYDYLRLLFARTGVPHCPVCGREIAGQTVDQITDAVLQLKPGTKFQVMAPVYRGKKGEFVKELEKLKRSGFTRVRVDGSVYLLDEPIVLDKNIRHDIDIIIDRLVLKEGIRSRLTDSIETALKHADGLVLIDVIGGEEQLFSQKLSCPEHNISIPELSPRNFSFNSPFGACPTCTGIGVFMKADPDLIVPDENKSLLQGAVRASGWSVVPFGNNTGETIAAVYYKGIAKHFGFDPNTPYKNIPKPAKDFLLYGSKGKKIEFERNNEWKNGVYSATFEGVIPNIERRYKETTSDWIRNDIETVMSECDCPDCKGKRLKPEILAVTVGGKNIFEVTCMQVCEEIEFFKNLQLPSAAELIAKPIVKEIIARLEFLKSVGLSYLTLSRGAATLSGGESQRIRLATQIGSALTGVLYVLDEPSIGLHQRDNEKLINTLKKLRDIGNTLIVVEHDEDTMRAADYLVDIGPGAGVHGGEIVCCGTPAQVAANKKSLTGDYLSGRKKIAIPAARRKAKGYLKVTGAAQNNLKNITVKFPLGCLTAVTGVSGSGKSSLVNGIVQKKLAAELMGAKTFAGKFKKMEGIEQLDKVINITQSPIGRTPRSNPATYTGVFNDIRELFAQSKDAKMRGYTAGRFSFNVKGGRCEACQGDGIKKIEMNFLPDVYVPCEVCGGTRYNRETLEVKYKGKSIFDVLEMTVEEGLHFFESVPKIQRKLQTLCEVGLGYVKIGQPATTLSGGEAQRVKLATELSRRATGRTVYILDEPTTGLHTVDVQRLIDVLQQLVDSGNSVLVIEHNLDVIKTADWIIDLGPEGGDGGGTVVCTGTPEQVAGCAESFTGQFLKPLLKKG